MFPRVIAHCCFLCDRGRVLSVFVYVVYGLNIVGFISRTEQNQTSRHTNAVSRSKYLVLCAYSFFLVACKMNSSILFGRAVDKRRPHPFIIIIFNIKFKLMSASIHFLKGLSSSTSRVSRSLPSPTWSEQAFTLPFEPMYNLE